MLGAGRNTLRLSPPLVLTKDEADTAVGIIDESLGAIEQRSRQSRGLRHLGSELGSAALTRHDAWHDMTTLGNRSSGEDLACDELERRGYAIVTRRYRTKYGELDIVARHGEYLVFVEVKARQGGSFGDPEEAVTLQKQQRMVWMATDYLARHRLDDVAVPLRRRRHQHRPTPPRGHRDRRRVPARLVSS